VQPPRDPAKTAWLIGAGYLLLTLLLTYPLWVDLAGQVLARDPDADLFIWTLAWDTHAFTARLLSIFDANIYYPQRLTLAYSENLIGDAIFAAPVLWLSGNPVLALNVTTLITCTLCGVGAYQLARTLGMDRPAAVLSGLIFAFAPPRFLRLGQLHLASIQWIPFSLAYLHAYFEGGQRRNLRLAVAFYSLQALSSGHGAVFATLAIGGMLVYRLALGEPISAAARLKDLGATGALLFAPAVLVMLPYLAVQREAGLRRSLDASQEWAVPASTFLASPTHLHVYLASLVSARRIHENARAFLFPGYLPLFLGMAAFVRVRRRAHSSSPTPWRPGLWRVAAALAEATAVVALALAIFAAVRGPFRWRIGETVLISAREPARIWLVLGAAIAARWLLVRRVPVALGPRRSAWLAAWRHTSAVYRHDTRLYFLLLTLLGVWLSLGPPLGLWPAVYWLPGFSFIRVPARFTLMSMVGLAALAGLGFQRITAAFRQSRVRACAVVVGVLLVCEFAIVPLGTTPYRIEIPTIDRWLDTQPKPFSIAEVPLPSYGAGGAWERRQTEYMLHSTAHWQKTVHGYSGFRAPLHIELYWQLRLFPDLQSLATLAQLGVTYVVVHRDLYPPEEWPLIDAKLAQFADRLKLEHEDASGRVYRLMGG
jgi:hypothetical protein